jgi:cellulose synthase/poly-beta-1,6-N-acetylglucosamine synthase-like glycosyltransferase
MREFATTVVLGFNWLVLGYAAAFALSQLLLVGLAAGHIVRTLRRDVESRMDDVFAHPNTPPVAVLVPAFNEERTIVESVRSVLALKYPEFETVVIEDGSTDGTFDALYKAFDLVQVHRVIPERVPVRGRVLSVHVPRDGSPLVVVRKQNAGRCADALNAGLNAARAPLVCMVDADSVIEPHALLHVVRPFVEDPDRVVAAGGVIRPSNGLRLARGSIASVSAPSRLLARIQVVEYLRAFLLGRVGWTWLNGNLIISGAFAIFRREDVIAVGGLSENSLGQDADLVASLHRTMSRQRADYSMVIVPQPVCWTEVPSAGATWPASGGAGRTAWSRCCGATASPSGGPGTDASACSSCPTTCCSRCSVRSWRCWACRWFWRRGRSACSTGPSRSSRSSCPWASGSCCR